MKYYDSKIHYVKRLLNWPKHTFIYSFVHISVRDVFRGRGLVIENAINLI